jgi:hypothetical protein
MRGLSTRQRSENSVHKGSRRLGAQLDRHAVAAAFTFIGEVDGEHMVERRVVGMIEIDVRGIDAHPALTAFGAADECGLFDDVIPTCDDFDSLGIPKSAAK